MSYTMSVSLKDNPAIGTTGKIPAKKGLQEILFIPSTGQVAFLLPEKLKQLQEGKNEGDNVVHYLSNKIIDELNDQEFTTNEERLKALNSKLFGADQLDVTPFPQNYKDTIKYIECVLLTQKETVLVAKEFIEGLEEKYVAQLLDAVPEGEDIFKKFKIEEKDEKKHTKGKQILNAQLDKKLRSKILEKLYPKTFRIEQKEQEKEQDKNTDSQDDKKATSKQIYKYEHAVDLCASLDLPNNIKLCIKGTKVSLLKKWEESYAVVEGKRDFNKENDKQNILTRLAKDNFSQDDAHCVTREIKDLWETDDNVKEFNNKFGFYTADIIFSEKSYREQLKDKVDQEPVPPNIFTATTEGALMRFAADASAKAESNIAEGKLLMASVEAEAKAALAEGSAAMKFYIPDERGHKASITINKRKETVEWKELAPIIDNSSANPANFHFDSCFVAPHTASGLAKQVSALYTIKDRLLGIDIIGHTDAVAAQSYNMELGLKRAEAAFAFLKEDYIGLAYFFQKGDWGEDQIEFMQAVINMMGSQSLDLSRLKHPEFANSLPNIKDAILNPDSLSESAGLNRILSFEDHHRMLKRLYPKYEELAKTPVTVNLMDDKMPNFKKGLVYLRGYSNSYVFGLLKQYRQSLIISKPNFDIDKIIQYRDGVISKGEQELLINTEARNQANRRVVLKGYTIASVSGSKNKNVKLDFGYFRMDVNGYASAFAGADLALAASVNISCKPEKLLLKGVITEEDKKTKEEKEKEKEGAANAISEGELEAFAGVKAEAGLKAALQWNQIEIKNNNCNELGNVGYAVNGSAGIGLEGEFKIGYDSKSGRFTIKAKASVTLGVGGGGTAEFTVGLGGLFELVKYVYKQLKDNDFNFIDLFDYDTYKIFVSWQVRMLQEGIDLAADAANAINNAATEISIKAQEILSDVDHLFRLWEKANQVQKEVEHLLESIENNNGLMPYLTPETKGRLLYYLTQHRIGTFANDIANLDLNHRSEMAAIQILKYCIVSKRDWQETFEHLVTNAKFDGKGAEAFKDFGNKKSDKNTNDIEYDSSILDINELWLKTHLLNDADDWAEVMKKRKELWTV